MEALKEALKRKMKEHAEGKKPDLEIAIGMGKPVPDQEHAGADYTEGDALLGDKKKLQEENDLAPDLDQDQAMEGQEGSKMDELLSNDKEEADTLKQILAALSDRSGMSSPKPMGLAERVAMGAKNKLNTMK